MSRNRTCGRRSRGWWGVFLCACLAMGAYIAFDVLDLDGSQMLDSSSGAAIASEPERVETDRFSRLAPLLPEALAPIDLSPDLLSISEPPRGSLRASVGLLTIHRATARPRADLRRETALGMSPTDDPALEPPLE